MDWFKRYGIPGAYFIIFTVLWIHAFYRCWQLKPEVLIQLGLFLFLPIGYVISVLSQLRYLGSKKGGLHTKAADRICISDQIDSNKEPNWEALSLLNAALLDTTTYTQDNKNRGKLEAHKFIQEWIRKRVDVLAINRSIQIAIFLSPISARIIGWVFREAPWQPFVELIILLFVISGIIVLIMWVSKKTLEEQITIVISGTWKSLGFIKFEGILSDDNPYSYRKLFLPEEWFSKK